MYFKGRDQGIQRGTQYYKFDAHGMHYSGGGRDRYIPPFKLVVRPALGEFDWDELPFPVKSRYVVTGDTLRIIWDEEGGAPPADFDAYKKDPRFTLRVLKRVK
jgi:hypothetical protein